MIAIEVQIAQVALNGAFQFGISGMFSGKPESSANRLTSEGGIGNLNPVDALTGKIVPGFNYTWQGAAAKAILNTLQTTGQSRTLASPTMITLDNQKVSFTNGTQISVRTQSSVATGTTQATDSFQYVNTGLTINITPRVSGNNVFLEIQQQNSNAVANADSKNPNPDITQNSQQTTVMVANGDTMLLSGLFIDTSSKGTDGFPVLSTIPLLGGLFGSQSWSSNRSELVMLVTPRVMATVEDTRGVVDELRQRMGNIENLLPVVGTRELPTASEAKKDLEARRAAEKIPLEFNQSLKVSPNTTQ
jgi:general secretion pathway protein D